MSKRCAFKNCFNRSDTVTVFSFPKEIERYKQWERIAQCDQPRKEPKYLCECHFSSIFISSNSRRKILIGAAVPNIPENYDTESERDETAQIYSNLDYQPEIVCNNENVNVSKIKQDPEMSLQVSNHSADHHTSVDCIEVVEDDEDSYSFADEIIVMHEPNKIEQNIKDQPESSSDLLDAQSNTKKRKRDDGAFCESTTINNIVIDNSSSKSLITVNHSKVYTHGIL